MRILIAEDEKAMSDALAAVLRHFGYEVDTAGDGAEAVALAGGHVYDCMVLDVMMPRMDGIEALSILRKRGDVTPVILLTAKAEIDDRITGLDAGADDYLTKPYATKELVARIRAALRRREEPAVIVDPAYTIRDLYIYPDRHEVRVGDEYIDLTKKEFDLILFLAKNKNRVLTRQQILEEVWGYGYVGNTNIVDVYVRYLRSKIDEKIGRKYIHTIRGIGYVVRD